MLSRVNENINVWRSDEKNQSVALFYKICFAFIPV